MENQLLQWTFQSARATAAREQMEVATESELWCLLFNTVTSSFRILSIIKWRSKMQNNNNKKKSIILESS